MATSVRHTAGVGEMDQVNSARAIKFGGDILVELQGMDNQGTIAVISYEFDFGDEGHELTPKEPIDDEHVSIVRDALVEDGFQWVKRVE